MRVLLKEKEAEKIGTGGWRSMGGPCKVGQVRRGYRRYNSKQRGEEDSEGIKEGDGRLGRVVGG